MMDAKHGPLPLKRDAFFAAARQRFGAMNQGQVDGITAILDEIENDGGAAWPAAFGAYILATCWHETAKTMLPVRETLGDSDAEVVRRLNRAWKAGRMPRVKTAYWLPDKAGLRWYGRGYVQLTHPENYAKAEKLTGFPLSKQPDLALQVSVAARILVRGMATGMFTGRSLSTFLVKRPPDYRGARAIINGTDLAALIEGYATQWQDALAAGGWR